MSQHISTAHIEKCATMKMGSESGKGQFLKKESVRSFSLVSLQLSEIQCSSDALLDW
jgi:hypothetical protein